MTPERWEKVKDVLGTILELPEGDRDSFLDRECAGDESLRSEIETLLRSEQHAGAHFLGEVSLSEVAASLILEEENTWIGRRVGAYQIVEQIGAGGMGEVYRAFRADDQYRKEVALKVIRAGQDSGAVISRFKNERQILASLEHPNIARLLDGGTTEGGAPYFAMELIEGEPITEYCDRRKLGIVERLQLFSQVCGAVQYAHQHLIIHRDIKPGNILVTADGVPKLLDFGIAKILEADAPGPFADETMTVLRVLTPRYGSPEQVQGSQMTTASDVYSLGVVLYELLTGQSPYRLSSGSPQDIVQAVCTTDPQKPSTAVYKSHASKDPTVSSVSREELSSLRGSSIEKLRKRLNGDLDNIVLMALQKDPKRRYRTVEQFQEDIRRHLENVPIAARTDTAWYRSSKFIIRHKAGVAFSASFALALVVGMAITLHEARIARQERARAELRFNDVRKLANSLMFEIHDSVSDIAGATAARKLIVTRGLEYLDSLSKEAAGDSSLQLELAAAYDRMGDLLGYNGSANLGDFQGALNSYRKSVAIREAVLRARPGDSSIEADLLNDYFRLSFVLRDAGDYAGALSDLHTALPLAQKLAGTQADPKYKDYLAGIYWQAGSIQNETNDYTRAVESFRQAVSIRIPIAGDAKSNPMFRTHLVADYLGLATALHGIGNADAAVDASKRGLSIVEELSSANPGSATLREYLGEAYDLSAPLYDANHDVNAALENYRSAHRIFAELRSADPTNSLARANFGDTDLGIARELMIKHNVAEAFPRIREAIETFEPIANKNRYDTLGLAQSYEAFGTAYQSLADHESSRVKKAAHLREAKTWLQKSLRIFEPDAPDSSHKQTHEEEANRVRRELAKCDSDLAQL